MPMETLFRRPDRLYDPIDVIVTVFNSPRYRTRWKLYEDFVRHVAQAGDAVRLWTVEIAFGHRDFAVTQRDNPYHLQLRTSSEIWHKERSQNLMLQRVVTRAPDAKYIAFVDPDITFIRPDWADETRHALQHHPVVQMWSEAYDLDSSGNVIQAHTSFARCHQEGMPINELDGYYYYPGGKGRIYWHPGYAWAWRRETINLMGGLVDYAILGSADFHMAHALVGNVDATIRRNFSKRLKSQLRDWQGLAEKHVRQNLGFCPGSIFHSYHGAKLDRKYQSRWRILEDTQFNPDTDLVPDIQGLYRLRYYGDNRSRQLRDKIRNYFHLRKEDVEYER